MLQSYFRIAWRHLTRNKAYSFINIAGLAIGMATALLIGLWITDETTFDHYHKNHTRIAEVMLKQIMDRPMFGGHASKDHPETSVGNALAPITGSALAKGYDDIFEKTAWYTWPDDHLLTAGDKSLSRQAIWTQATFPDILTLQMLSGSVAAFKDPQTLLLAASAAKALFGKTDPIGKTVRLDNNQNFHIGGVYADLPDNTSFHEIQMLLPWDNQSLTWLTRDKGWNMHGPRLLTLLTPGTTVDQATARIRLIPKPYFTDHIEELLAYPLDRLHLHDEFDKANNGAPSGGRIRFLWLFGTIGAFVLLLACINFMNLSTARSEQRAKEVGIRKTIGSLRGQLIAQFLGESLLTATLALAGAILLTAIALPAFNALSEKQLHFPWANAFFWLGTLAFTLLTGLLAGSYPAFYLSGFSPVHGFTRRTTLPRKILVVTQFSVSLSLIIGTIIIFRQIQFAKDRSIGYTRDGLITVYENTDTLRNNYPNLRNDLLRSGLVTAVAESSQSTTLFDQGNSLYWPGITEAQGAVIFRDVFVDPDFGKTVGWTVTQGRDFSRQFATDSDAIILNETGAKTIGFKNPIGQQISYFNHPYRIIGIVSDMLTNSPYGKVEPALFILHGGRTVITMRLNPGTPIHTALAGLEPLFRRYNPASPFLYNFNDTDFSQKFAAENRIGNLAAVFASLAIFISCLGLFGLASFVAEQRTKEIGIRKVLGAGIGNLWALLSSDFIRLTLLSMCISMPLIGLAMNKWLQNYEYHAPLSWWIFASAGAGILILTLITVSFQSLKAALMNPVQSLRSE